MKGDDLVDLCFVDADRTWPIYARSISRKDASDAIKEWQKAREKVRKGGKKPLETVAAQDWLKYGTFAVGSQGDDGESYDSFAISLETVVAIYVVEREGVKLPDLAGGNGEEVKGSLKEEIAPVQEAVEEAVEEAV